LIDRFGVFLLIVTYSPLEQGFMKDLVALLMEKFPEGKIRIQFRSAGKSEDVFISDDCPENVTIEEEGLQFLVHTKRGQNPGFFADMKMGRDRVKRYIGDLAERKNGKEKDILILNLFAYTCAFSVVALHSGASRVDNWDMNGTSLGIGRKNHQLNNLDPRGSAFFAYDIFKSFGKIKKRGPYDLVILDPPPQQGQSFQYKKDYPRLMMRLEQILVPSGAVLFCLNATDCDKSEFLNMIVSHTPGSFKNIENVPCPPEYLGRYPDRGLKTFLASDYNPPRRFT